MANTNETDTALWGAVRQLFPNTAAILAFLAFNLFCAPCVAAIGAIRREMQSIKWTLFAILYQTLFAYGIAFFVYQYGRIVMGESFRIESAVAIVLSILFIILIVRSLCVKWNLKTEVIVPLYSHKIINHSMVCGGKHCDHCPYHSCYREQ